ncbi:MAG: hypothetical protein VX278_08935 [Myxococcota bacterium]|nr:hypothetical protein [Myxococcota bacterium]
MILLYLLGCTLSQQGAKSEIDALIASDENHRACNKDTLFVKGETVLPDPTFNGQLKGEAKSYNEQALPIVVAMDHSGSMYGGYAPGVKANSPVYFWEQTEFQTLLKDSVFSFDGAAEYYPLLFNRNVQVLEDAGGLYLGANQRFLRKPKFDSKEEALKKITAQSIGGSLPQKPWDYYDSKEPYQETRTDKVLDAAADIFQRNGAESGILWIITDNIIDKGENLSEEQKKEAKLNEDFYRRLRSDARWQIIDAYPVSRGDWLKGSTIMIYAMYYGTHQALGEIEYQSWHANGGPLSVERNQSAFARVSDTASPSPGAPIRLKPDYLHLINIAFEGGVQCTLTEVGTRRICSSTVGITNQLGHRRILGGTVTVESSPLIPYGQDQDEIFYQASPLSAGAFRKSVSIGSKQKIDKIEPYESKNLVVQGEVDAVEKVLITAGDYIQSAQNPRFFLQGNVKVKIENLETEFAIPKHQLQSIYGIESLPSVFQSFYTTRASTTRCVSMETKNPSYWPAVMGVSLVFGGLFAFAGLGILLRPSYYQVVLNEEVLSQKVRCSRLKSVEIVHRNKLVALVKLKFNGDPTITDSPLGRVIPTGRRRWKIRDESDFGGESILILRKWTGSQTKRNKDAF